MTMRTPAAPPVERTTARTRPSRSIGWFLVIVGVAIGLLWAVLLVSGGVPEVERGELAIWFHIGAEMVTAGLLVSAGIGLLARRDRARRTAGVAIGALIYTTIASPGYYAEAGEWVVVAMFGLLAVVTAVVAGRIIGSP